MGLNLRPLGSPSSTDTGPIIPPLPGTTGLDGIDKDKVIKLGGIALAVGGGLYILSKAKLGTPPVTPVKPVTPPTVKYTLTLSLTPNTVSVGGSFQATAAITQDNFIQGSKVRIEASIQGLTSNKEEFLLTDEPEQNFTTAFPVNTGTPIGSYTITATIIAGATILKTATSKLTVQAAAGTGGGGGGGAPPLVPAQPSNLTAPFTMSFWTDNIRLNWLNKPGTNWIKFELEPEAGVDSGDVDRSLFQAQVYEKIQTLSLPTPKIDNGPYTFLPDTKYIWRVYASSKTDKPSATDLQVWSTPAQSEFKTPKVNSNGIKPVYPSNGESSIPSSDDSGGLTLRWTNSDQYIFMYEINISADAEFKGQGIGPYIVHSGKQSPKNSWNVTQYARIEPGTKYWWRIRPLVAGGGVPWSTVWTFTTKGAAITPPAGPGPTSPNGPISGQVTSLSATPDITSPTQNSTVRVRVQATATSPIVNGAVQLLMPSTDTHTEINWNNSTTLDYTFQLSIPSNAPAGNQTVIVTVFSGSQSIKETRFVLNIQTPSSGGGQSSTPSASWNITGSGNEVRVTVNTVTGADSVEVWLAGANSNQQAIDGTWRKYSSKSGKLGQDLGLKITVTPDAYKQYPYLWVAIVLKLAGSEVATGNPFMSGYMSSLAKVLSISTASNTTPPSDSSTPTPSTGGGGDAVGGESPEASQLYRIR